MFPWHSSIATAGGNAAALQPTNPKVDAAYRQLLMWLASAPRNPHGRLADPAAMLHALPFKLTSKGAGTLLALCDLKGQPSREEFESCVMTSEADSGLQERTPQRPPQKGRGVGHLCSATAKGRSSSPGRGPRAKGAGRGTTAIAQTMQPTRAPPKSNSHLSATHCGNRAGFSDTQSQKKPGVGSR